MAKNITSVQWEATNLPAGLSIDASTGIISGTPEPYWYRNSSKGIILTDSVIDSESKELGKSIKITTNYGSDTKNITFVIKLSAKQPFIYPFNQSVEVTKGVTMTPYQIKNMRSTGDSITNTEWAVDTLPSGLSLDATTGIISGTPNADVGSYTTAVELKTNFGWTKGNITITVIEPEEEETYPPVIDEGQSLTLTVGEAMTPYTVTGTNVTLTDAVPSANAPKITAGQVISFSNQGIGGIGNISQYTLQGTNVTLGENGVTNVEWNISGLPANMYDTDYTQSRYFDANTGTFKSGFGYAMSVGTYTVPVTVTTNYGTDTENVTLDVSKSKEPV